MFKSEKENDKLGKSQTRFYLTQGDSCTIYVTPKKDGQLVDLSLIDFCKFKLSDKEYAIEFEKNLTLDTVNNRYILNLTHDDTKNFEIAQHIYEFEYTFIDGGVFTPNQYKFDILSQIIE